VLGKTSLPEAAYIISKAGDTANNGEWELSSSTAVGWGLHFMIKDATDGTYIARSLSSSAVIQDGNWHYIVGVWNGSIQGSSIKVYMDGIRVDDTDQGAASITAIRNTDAKVGIGGRYGGGFTSGTIDEVRIAQAEWSAARIKAEYEMVKYNYSTLGPEQSPPADTSFTVSLPAGTTIISFISLNKSSKEIQAQNQTSIAPIINITNTGNVAQNFKIRILNEAPSWVALYGDDAYLYSSGVIVNATAQTVISNLASGLSKGIWLWSNFTSAPKGTNTTTFEVSSQQYT
jgi:hypothetical protein